MAKHTPLVEQRRLVARWRDTDHPKATYARSVGVHPSTFAMWVRKHPEQVPLLTSAPAFIDVTPVPVAEHISVRLGLHGEPLCEMQFDTLPPPTWFAAVLREVTAC